MLIFRELEDLVLEVKGRIALLGLEDDVTLDERRLELLVQLVSYVNGMTWVAHAKLAAKVRVFLRSRYRYEEVAQAFNTTLKEAHKSISYAGQRLRRQVGSTLLLIREGRLDEAQRELALVTGAVDASSIFAGSIMGRFAPNKSAGVVLGDCRKELGFLSAFSRRNFDRIVSGLSEEKISQLLYIILSADPTYVQERVILLDCMVDGRMTVDDCIRALNDEFIFGSPGDGAGF